MTKTTETEITPMLTPEEVAAAIDAEAAEAAELEGLVAIDGDPHLTQLVFAYKQARFAEKQARENKGKIADALMAALTERGAEAFTIGGQPMARRQESVTTTLDSKKLKDDMPELWLKYARQTSTVKLWVRPQDGDAL